MGIEIIPEKSKSFSVSTVVGQDTESKYGIIVILDALGSKGLSIEDSKNFISKINEIKAIVIEGLAPIMVDLYKEYYEPDKPHKIESFTFQDTIILSLETGNLSRTLRLISFMSEITSHFIVAGLRAGLYFRGALSIGEYIRFENYILGPAISDAASWYEDADFIGCIITPNSGKHLFNLWQSIDDERTDFSKLKDRYKFYINYNNLTLKSGKKALWHVSWIAALAFTKVSQKDYGVINTCLHLYYSMLSKATIPKGAESKYDNTHIYVEEYLKKYPELNAYNMMNLGEDI